MTAIAYTQFRRKVGEVIDNLVADGEPVTITRADGKNLVLVTAEEWESVQETLYLMSSEENAKRLRKSIADAKAGKLVERSID